MASVSPAVAKAPTTGSLPHLDGKQVLKATKALTKHIGDSKKSNKTATTPKKSLLDDDDDENASEESIWLVVTAKQHFLNSNRLYEKTALPPNLLESD
jgi:ribosome biogenesis protein UTP30